MIRALFCIKIDELCHIGDSAASLQPQKQKSKTIGYFEEFISLKQRQKQQKHASSFCEKFLTSRYLTEEPGN